jgi:hypothetical protein
VKFSDLVNSPALPPRPDGSPLIVTYIPRETRHRDAELIRDEIAGQPVIRVQVPDIEPGPPRMRKGTDGARPQWKAEGDDA